METIFIGMISIKYQLTWEPQPGVQCVKGKCTSHFHQACPPGKEGLRFALIMPGFGITFVAFNQTTPDPTQMYAVRSIYTTCPCSPVCARVSRSAKATANLWGFVLGARGGSHLLPWPPGSGLPSSPPTKCKVLSRPRHASREPHSLGPGGQGEPLAVRLYGPPLRPAEASPRQREESRREQRCRLRADPSARLSRPHLLHSVAWCENASPGRTGAAASAAAARAVGGGRGGAEVRGGGG